jgi:hypothetical protein
MAIAIEPKKKYRQRAEIKTTKYRARTGPSCCNGKCGRSKQAVNWRKDSGKGDRK